MYYPMLGTNVGNYGSEPLFPGPSCSREHCSRVPEPGSRLFPGSGTRGPGTTVPGSNCSRVPVVPGSNCSREQLSRNPGAGNNCFEEQLFLGTTT